MLGVGVCIFFLPLPDKYGRKKCLCFLTPALVISFSMVVYGNSSWIKALGYFINGAARSRYSICLSICVESSESKYGALASTYIFGIDCASLCLTCLFFRFVSNDAFIVLSIFNVFGLVACVTSFLTFHESPKWLVLKHRTKEAIDVIN